jgi:hypothetical protein
MTFYLSSPGNQMTADHCRDMPVLVSYALYSKWMDQYVPSFSRVLVDSGAYSEFNSGKVIDGHAYRDWCQRWNDTAHIDAIAGLDDIRGDWRRSLKNYELFGGFPTFHETDPPELLEDLLPIARERGRWLGVGLLPPRSGKWRFVKETLARIPQGIHVHFWAGGEYCGHPRVNSCDSTNWLLDAMAYRKDLPFLTMAECVELVVKRYKRINRKPVDQSFTKDLFSECMG